MNAAGEENGNRHAATGGWLTFQDLVSMSSGKLGYNHCVALLGLVFEALNPGKSWSSAGSMHASIVGVSKIKPHRGSTMHRFEGVGPHLGIDEEAPRGMVNLRVSGVWACRAFSMGPRQAACMPQSFETSQQSPIEGPRCTLSRVLDHTCESTRRHHAVW